MGLGVGGDDGNAEAEERLGACTGGSGGDEGDSIIHTRASLG